MTPTAVPAPVVPIVKSLNKGQQAAADGFFEFLFSDQTELIISGPGGVGKTFLMGHLIDKVMPQYHESCRLMGIDPLYDQVMMTATTNKAREALEASTRRPTKTIHSFLNLRVYDDFETGATKLTKNMKTWVVHHNKIIFVDECSMIDFTLRKFLKEGTHQCKIIYVGDHCQLPPVKEKLSPIYQDNLPFFELTKSERTSDPYLQALNAQLRATVETDVFRAIKPVPGIIDLLDGPTMEKEIEAHFKNPSNHDRILAYSNNRVIEYNDHIRAMRGLPTSLTVGERVINNSGIQIGKSMMGVEDEFEVLKVASTVTTAKIAEGVELEVMLVDLKGPHGNFMDVPVPMNRAHFTQLVKHYGKHEDWKHYFALKNNYPDLRPRDAATVHKAQGSTYDTAFIDMDDLSTCKDRNVAARLLYVWATRARKRVVMYGNLAKKYGGYAT